MDPETPGYKLISAHTGETIQLTATDASRHVKCGIEAFRFSAHSRRENLLAIVSKLTPKRVILVHGEESAVHWMGNAILAAHPGIKVHSAELEKEISIS
jgi:Cft2 family RNA processing exonuclease